MFTTNFFMPARTLNLTWPAAFFTFSGMSYSFWPTISWTSTMCAESILNVRWRLPPVFRKASDTRFLLCGLVSSGDVSGALSACPNSAWKTSMNLLNSSLWVGFVDHCRNNSAGIWSWFFSGPPSVRMFSCGNAGGALPNQMALISKELLRQLPYTPRLQSCGPGSWLRIVQSRCSRPCFQPHRNKMSALSARGVWSRTRLRFAS